MGMAERNNYLLYVVSDLESFDQEVLVNMHLREKDLPLLLIIEANRFLPDNKLLHRTFLYPGRLCENHGSIVDVKDHIEIVTFI